MITDWGAEQWFAFLLDCTLKTSVVLLAAWSVSFALRRKSSAVRHLVWSAALLSAALLPICSILIPSWHSRLGLTASSRLLPLSEIPLTSAISSAAIVSASTEAESLFTSDKLAVLVWTLGFGIGALILLAGTLRLIWIAYRARPVSALVWKTAVSDWSRRLRLDVRVRLRRTTTIPMLVTWGALRPEVLLPPGAEDWQGSRIHAALGHELAHVRRHDWLVQMFAEIVRAFYWFNPLVWIACNRLQQESERACDDAVLLSGVDGADYAGELLALARLVRESNRMWSPSLAMARESTLERRFAAMLNTSIDRRSISRTKVFATFALSLALVLPLAAMRAPIQNGPGTLVGKIYDANGTPVQNAVIVAVNESNNKADMTSSNALGVFQLRLPAGVYDVSTAATGFLPFQARAISIDSNQDANLNVLTLAAVSVPQPQLAVPAAPKTPLTIRQGGAVQATKLITKIQPRYPQSARTARIQGSVILGVKIGPDGVPESMEVISNQADPDLVQASVDAVKQWRYQPTLLNGQPVSVDTTVTVNFSLGSDAPPPAQPAPSQPAPQIIGLPVQRIDAGACFAPHCTVDVAGQSIAIDIEKALKVNPPYPPEARTARIQGTVVLKAAIGIDGLVDDLQVVSGHPLLTQAAIDAVKQWKYQPVVINGHPVALFNLTVNVNFSLGQ